MKVTESPKEEFNVGNIEIIALRYINSIIIFSTNRVWRYECMGQRATSESTDDYEQMERGHNVYKSKEEKKLQSHLQYNIT